jgi:hypothetical protein
MIGDNGAHCSIVGRVKRGGIGGISRPDKESFPHAGTKANGFGSAVMIRSASGCRGLISRLNSTTESTEGTCRMAVSIESSHLSPIAIVTSAGGTDRQLGGRK